MSYRESVILAGNKMLTDRVLEHLLQIQNFTNECQRAANDLPAQRPHSDRMSGLKAASASSGFLMLKTCGA